MGGTKNSIIKAKKSLTDSMLSPTSVESSVLEKKLVSKLLIPELSSVDELASNTALFRPIRGEKTGMGEIICDCVNDAIVETDSSTLTEFFPPIVDLFGSI